MVKYEVIVIQDTNLLRSKINKPRLVGTFERIPNSALDYGSVNTTPTAPVRL
jgi:hypothetical protein